MSQLRHDLEDRPRMMALVFGIRLMVLGLALSIVAGSALFFPRLIPTQVTSLLGLFSYFMMMISVLLIVIRSSRLSSRVLILSPLLVFLAPNWELQFTLLCLTILFCLEGFRRQASEVGQAWGFVTAQFLWGLGGGGLPFLAPKHRFLALGILGVLVTLSCAAGFWLWQKNLKKSLESLDLDADLE